MVDRSNTLPVGLQAIATGSHDVPQLIRIHLHDLHTPSSCINSDMFTRLH